MSIIEEALRKAAEGRDKTKNRPDKITSPPKETTHKREAHLEPRVSSADSKSIKFMNGRHIKNSTLIVSGISLLAIIFLAIIHIFLIPPSDIKGKTTDDFIETPLEAEAYTEVKSEVALIDDKRDIIYKMAKVFKFESTREQFLSNFTLNGIVYDTEDPWAIINNKVVRVGETLDGATVISIAPQKVTLLFKNESFDLAVK